MHDRKYTKKDYPKYMIGDLVLFDEMRNDEKEMVYLTQGIIKSSYGYDWNQESKLREPSDKSDKFEYVYVIDTGVDKIEEVMEFQIITKLK